MDLDADQAEAAEARAARVRAVTEALGGWTSNGRGLRISGPGRPGAGRSPCPRKPVSASLQLSVQHRDFRVCLGLQALILVLADDGYHEDAVTAYGHMVKWTEPTHGTPGALYQLRLASIMEQLSPKVVEDLLAQAREADAWDFAAHWAAELARMV